MPRLSVILPTYNEADNIARLVPMLRETFADEDVEILVVDDDSADGTGQVAQDAGARAIVRTGERGLATAVVRGFEEARAPWVAVMDADFQHPPAALRRMWDRAQDGDVDLVVGSRYAAGGGEGTFSSRRRFVSRGATLLAALALPPLRRNRITDPMSGLFMVRRELVAGAPLRPTGYKILLEVIARTPVQNVAEVGFVFGTRQAGQSKLSGGVIVHFLLHIGRLVLARPTVRISLGLLAALGAIVVWVATT